MLAHRLLDAGHDLLRRGAAGLFEQGGEPFLAEPLPRAIFSLDQTVGEQAQRVAVAQIERPFLVAAPGEETQRPPGGAQRFDPAAAPVQVLRVVASIDVAQAAAAAFDDADKQSQVGGCLRRGFELLVQAPGKLDQIAFQR